MIDSEVEALRNRCRELAEENLSLVNAHQNRDNAQIRAWAIDRGIETIKHSGVGGDADQVIKNAEKFIEWVNGAQSTQVTQ